MGNKYYHWPLNYYQILLLVTVLNFACSKLLYFKIAHQWPLRYIQPLNTNCSWVMWISHDPIKGIYIFFPFLFSFSFFFFFFFFFSSRSEEDDIIQTSPFRDSSVVPQLHLRNHLAAGIAGYLRGFNHSRKILHLLNKVISWASFVLAQITTTQMMIGLFKQKLSPPIWVHPKSTSGGTTSGTSYRSRYGCNDTGMISPCSCSTGFVLCWFWWFTIFSLGFCYCWTAIETPCYCWSFLFFLEEEIFEFDPPFPFPLTTSLICSLVYK